jgi:hydrogenase maturation protein HypF
MGDSACPPEADALALRFHLDVARAVLGECRRARDASVTMPKEARHKIKQRFPNAQPTEDAASRGTSAVCLSGGVFQNKILMDEVLRLLRTDGFTPYFNISVPPNDGGIALGQAYIAMRQQCAG